MGNKKNHKKTCNKKSLYLQEWRVLKSFGLTTPKTRLGHDQPTNNISKTVVSACSSIEPDHKYCKKTTNSNETMQKRSSLVPSYQFATSPVANDACEPMQQDSFPPLSDQFINPPEGTLAAAINVDNANTIGTSPITSVQAHSPATATNGAIANESFINDILCDWDTDKDDNEFNFSPEIISGRRIVDINHFLSDLRTASAHGEQYGCTFQNLVLIKEICRGMKSCFVFRCNMCHKVCRVNSEPISDSKNINTEAVASIMSTGGGCTSLQQVMEGIDVPCMTFKTYDYHHSKVSEAWEEIAMDEMRHAAEEESRLAIERGDVDKEGVPLLTVVADGSWSKRSYGTNYNSLSGVATIVGYYTRKVLYIGVKNKYCATCSWKKGENYKVPEHKCFKNWSESSSSMETAVIVEGFLKSREMYNVKYAKLVADGDCSVYSALIAVRPYDDTMIVKVECRNHLFRNYCNKLREIATTSLKDKIPSADKGLHIRCRKSIGSSVLRLRVAVTKAIQHRKNQSSSSLTKVQDLRKDILNGPSHVFGEHLRCKDIGYFCKGKKENEQNLVPDMKKCGVWPTLMKAVEGLADNSNHLIQDMDSNLAEHYNSAVARLIGAKRVNYCLKGSYRARCAAAVISHNTGSVRYKLHKRLWQHSPGAYTKRLEERTRRKIALARERNLKNTKTRRRLIPSSSAKKPRVADYGPNIQKPDIDKEIYRLKCDEFISNLKKSPSEIQHLEENTRDQSGCELWQEERRVRITASNFGTICNKRATSKSAPIVTSLLYSYYKESPAMQYGRENESTAIHQLSKRLGKPISKCGLFVDDEHPFLGASPDGLIDDDGIVEIKCPFAGKDMTPDEVIRNKKGLVGTMFYPNKYEDGDFKIKKHHKYYYQVQGQLHITKRQYCVFAIWTPLGLKDLTILRDDAFWQTEMEDKLRTFYFQCLLPELVDPRKRRFMPLREPLTTHGPNKTKRE